MREMKDSGIEWIGEIPADWELSKIGAVYEERNEKVSDVDFQPLSITKQGVVPQLETAAKTNDGENRKLIRKNDFVINSRSDRRGSCGISEYDGSCSLINTVLKPRRNMCNAYYSFVFRSERFADELYRWGNGIVDDLWSTKWSNMKRIYIPAPSLQEQRCIADYLDRKCSQIDAIIARQQEVIEKLKAYKLSVITEAVTKGLNPDVPMKDSGVEWIGEIPEHWEIRRIGSFARVTSSKRIFEESYVDEGVPFYRSKEITDLSKGLHVQTEIFIPEEVFEQVNEASPAPKCGDILLTSIGTIGNTWISDGRKFYYKDGNITQIEANDSFDSAYVEYCFSSNVVLEQYTRLAMGSTLLALTIIKIKKILVAFPPLDEQRKIVQYLKLKCSSIDAAIKNKENLITKLVDYKKSLIYEVVTGKKEV